MTTFRDTSFVAVGCNGAVSRNLSVRGNKNNRSIVKEDIYNTAYTKEGTNGKLEEDYYKTD